MKMLPSYPKCDYRVTISNGLSRWCTHPIRVSEHGVTPHCWGLCEYLEYDEKYDDTVYDEMVLANPDIPFMFFPVMYLPKYNIFISFASYERFDNVTNEEADYILHHAPFPQSIRVIIFVGAVYRAAQTVTKTIIGHF